MIASEQSECIVQCVRDAGSMYEEDARAFLAEHDGHVRAKALAEGAEAIDVKQDEYEAEERKQFGTLDHETVLQGEAVRDMAALLRQMADGEKATPDFFQRGHTYKREHHGDTITFKVTAISTSPDGRYRVAHGWRTWAWDTGWEPTDSDDLTGWTDVTEAGEPRG
ncbi:hypothetical protein GCM10023084_02560 [Streptomyces lacrimifluminis]|uniref:hypothetical protein n=1 Tax=Streptomyces lacrimifluminis TaxID=1500077 RepID=UPI0031F19BB0